MNVNILVIILVFLLILWMIGSLLGLGVLGYAVYLTYFV